MRAAVRCWRAAAGRALPRACAAVPPRRQERTAASGAGPAHCAPRVCVIGGGPAGFFTAHQLVKLHPTVEVDVVELLPVPYGLVRFGVAPDHPEVKNVIETFDAVATSGRCNYYGNVAFGRDFFLPDIQHLYSAVVLSYGCSEDRRLGVPGEDLDGVYSARAFVNWYNGHPDAVDLAPMLRSGPDAVVFGHGNVALDVARVLLAPREHLAATDVCSHALDALSESTIERVHVMGRRGPLEVAFTIKELRELTKLEGCTPHIDPAVMALSDEEAAAVAADRRKKRLVALMQTIAEGTVTLGAGDHAARPPGVNVVFHRSPVSIEPSAATPSTVGGVTLEVNELDGPLDARVARGTGVTEALPCGAVFRSIGYKGVGLDPAHVPFDERRGVVPNTLGRVDGVRGLYCAGWIKTGPTGVIATTMANAYQTAGSITADFAGNGGDGGSSGDVGVGSNHAAEGPCPGSDEARAFFAGLDKPVVTFDGWKAIEAAELAEGSRLSKAAEKMTSLEQMVDTARSAGGVLKA